MPAIRPGGARQRHRSPGWRSSALAGLVFLLSGLPATTPQPLPVGSSAPHATTEIARPVAVHAVAPSPAPPARPASPRRAPAPSAARPDDAAALPSGPPTSVSIPAIGVDASIVTLGLNGDGSLEVPAATADTGWFRYGPRPGEEGPAVIAGHVDSRAGPAVFYRLRDLRPGDVVVVSYGAGHEVGFRVTRVEQHPKDAFPTARVYGRTPGAELRLITCGGTFDRTSRHYRDNVVVFAEVTDGEAAGSA